jgi:hypothetical protein
VSTYSVPPRGVSRLRMMVWMAKSCPVGGSTCRLGNFSLCTHGVQSKIPLTAASSPSLTPSWKPSADAAPRSLPWPQLCPRPNPAHTKQIHADSTAALTSCLWGTRGSLSLFHSEGFAQAGCNGLQLLPTGLVHVSGNGCPRRSANHSRTERSHQGTDTTSHRSHDSYRAASRLCGILTSLLNPSRDTIVILRRTLAALRSVTYEARRSRVRICKGPPCLLLGAHRVLLVSPT